MKKVQGTRVQKAAPGNHRRRSEGAKKKYIPSPIHQPITQAELEVRAKMLAGIEMYVRRAGGRTIERETSYVSNLDNRHRVILFGKNRFEGLMVEYEGPLGYWRCRMGRALCLEGHPYIDRYKTAQRAQH